MATNDERLIFDKYGVDARTDAKSLGADMNFTNLPASCPPTPHETTELKGVYRILLGSSACAQDWLSHQARGQAMSQGMDPCEFASLSLMRDPKAAKKLKNLKHLTHAAKMDIPAETGAHKSRGNHIHFWAASGAVLAAHVVDTVAI